MRIHIHVFLGKPLSDQSIVRLEVLSIKTIDDEKLIRNHKCCLKINQVEICLGTF